MTKYLALIPLCLLPSLVFAYILPTKTILQKTAENAGSGVYAIEQEVEFQNGQDVLSLKEMWLIENERTMRLTVTGTKEQSNNIRLQFLYNGGQRYRLVDGNRKHEAMSEDFLEKYFNFRNADIFTTVLVNAKILPSAALSKKPSPKSGADFKYEPESWIRHSRAGGVVNYGFGVATPVGQQVENPGIWIEQDQFVVRKLRLSSQVEMTAENYNTFTKGLQYPRHRTIRWGNNSANIRLISASGRPANATFFQPSSLDVTQKLDGLNDQPAKEAVLEFYSRFR